MVFFCLRLIDWLVPDVPESLEVKIKRERYLAKQALADNHDVLLTVSPDSPSPGQCAGRCMRVPVCLLGSVCPARVSTSWDTHGIPLQGQTWPPSPVLPTMPI